MISRQPPIRYYVAGHYKRYDKWEESTLEHWRLDKRTRLFGG